MTIYIYNVHVIDYKVYYFKIKVEKGWLIMGKQYECAVGKDTILDTLVNVAAEDLIKVIILRRLDDGDFQELKLTTTIDEAAALDKELEFNKKYSKVKEKKSVGEGSKVLDLINDILDAFEVDFIVMSDKEWDGIKMLKLDKKSFKKVPSIKVNGDLFS